ncbi:hypothetical protein ACQ3G6_16310 [Allorhizobium undicola]|uniref:hypothetical protein n=1 Tax=Allorhizobium undicola TaxID=78527 RepID=UPI0004834A66|nr:hypothetical protein [Allorhizobium undicola]
MTNAAKDQKIAVADDERGANPIPRHNDSACAEQAEQDAERILSRQPLPRSRLAAIAIMAGLNAVIREAGAAFVDWEP